MIFTFELCCTEDTKMMMVKSIGADEDKVIGLEYLPNNEMLPFPSAQIDIDSAKRLHVFLGEVFGASWVSVEDRLPDIGEIVLIFAVDAPRPYKIEMAMRTEQANIDAGGMFWFYPENNGWHEEEITHWMPLPGNPNE